MLINGPPSLPLFSLMSFRWPSRGISMLMRVCACLYDCWLYRAQVSVEVSCERREEGC